MKAKLNNEGAALVSVLVVTTFITLLATTLLYTAAMNYQQKLTDYQNKDSFYRAEMALDELKSLVVQDVQKAYLEAYNNTSRRYAILGSADARQQYFQDEFNNKLIEIWDKNFSDAGNDLVMALQSVMTGEYASDAACIYKASDYGLYSVISGSSTATKFVLHGVRSKYTSGTYTTFLYTDICVEAPTLNWSTGSSSTGEHEEISFTDCVSYINWQKADYDDDDAGDYDTIDIGTKN